MSIRRISSQLPKLLALDALTCAATGLLLVTLAGVISSLTALPELLLLWAGLALLPVAVFMAVIARQSPPADWAVAVIVFGNIGWVLASLALLVSPLISPNLIGWVFVLAQAAAVALLAWLEFAAVRRGPVSA